jgi:hypothetical protein
MEIRLYKLLNLYKWRMTKQQYKTIKGQIKKGDFDGALKGISRA